jgi:hypothetical protein
MPFIGNQPALSYTSFAKQDFTTSATTSYTLDHPVTNENEIALFINFVRQEPTTAYSASGTTLTLTSATSASDDMYCVFLGKAVQTVNPPAGSVGASQIADSSIALGKLSATGTKDSTTFLRGDNTFATPAGGDNTPSFSVTLSGNQSLTGSTWSVAQFNTEDWDTNSAFDTSTYTFTVPSGEAGKYFFRFQAGIGDIEDRNRILLAFRFNNSGETAVQGLHQSKSTGGNMYANTAIIKNMSVGDTIKALAYHDMGTAQNLFSGYSYFTGHKLIGV